uniref:Cell shape-determining protein MreC n=1 Tax=Schlesneria paludicola TaxID=360056 RepID=A0A7C4LMY6_9PLAN
MAPRVRTAWLFAAAALLAAAVLWHAPPALARQVQVATLDALRPGCRWWQWLAGTIQTWRAARETETIRELRERLAQTEAACQRQTERVARLSAEIATLRERAAAWQPAYSGTSSERLFIPGLVEAGVLGGGIAAAWRDGRVLDRGWKHGVRESALVLHSRQPLIDLGAAAEISPEDPLLWGQAIIGKVHAVGRWTSTYLSITDVDYRGRAQLLRDSAQGPVWGAQGLLRGDGQGRCRLEGIPIENAVRVGDLVCSAERDGALPLPLFYGRVIAAQPAPGEREWSLIVEPAAQPSCLTHVQVLRAALNPARYWGN